MLQDLADAIYPPREERIIQVGSKTKTIKLGTDNYINRLVAYLEDNTDSERLKAIVGSNIDFIGDRLDAVFQAAQKGSHSTITNRFEADRYVIHLYAGRRHPLPFRTTIEARDKPDYHGLATDKLRRCSGCFVLRADKKRSRFKPVSGRGRWKCLQGCRDSTRKRTTLWVDKAANVGCCSANCTAASPGML